MHPYSNVITSLILCATGIYLSENSPLMPTPRRIVQTILMATAVMIIVTNLGLL